MLLFSVTGGLVYQLWIGVVAVAGFGRRL